ncbi:MAG: Bax inhibitor-1/YccA family protein [Rhodobacteraceae bacterium]|nr:Bax inhibitor-1/YccA family protein [Paracoccaceae bacterium]
MADNQTVRRAGSVTRTAEIDAGLRAHMNKVYGLMSVAMIVTGLVSYLVGSDLNAAMNGQETRFLSYEMINTLFFTSPMRYVVLFAPLAMVLLFGTAVKRMSQAGAQGFFFAFAALMGLSISSIFAVYTGYSIAQTFFVTSIAFASLSLYGYTTKKDISAWGSFLIMGVFGLIIAMIVNLFLQSAAIEFAISALGVLIFAGLTAYDTQKIKTQYLQVRNHPDGEAIAAKMAIQGALKLYLDFINLFLFLLRFMGNRN